MGCDALKDSQIKSCFCIYLFTIRKRIKPQWEILRSIRYCFRLKIGLKTPKLFSFVHHPEAENNKNLQRFPLMSSLVLTFSSSCRVCSLCNSIRLYTLGLPRFFVQPAALFQLAALSTLTNTQRRPPENIIKPVISVVRRRWRRDGVSKVSSPSPWSGNGVLQCADFSC